MSLSELNFSLFWVITTPIFFVWALGVYLIVKGWGRKERQASVLPVPKKKTPALLPETPIPEKEEFPPEEPIKEQTFQEIEIEPQTPEPQALEPHALEPHAIEPQGPKKEDKTEKEDFYQDFGKTNIIEFPAEYIDENSVKGFDGSGISLVEFAKNCYTQIGFMCVETVLTKKLPDRTYNLSIFDLISDHYAIDEQDYVDFFGENKEKFSKELASLKKNPEFVYENVKILRGSPDGLPQLIAWDDKELFLVSVKPKQRELTQKETKWLKEFIVEKKLVKARIFKITEKKASPALPLAKPKPLLPPEPRLTPPEAKEKVEKIRRKPFGKLEIKFIKENTGKMTNEQIADKLGRSVDSITHKLSRIGLSRESFVWTKAMDKFLKDNCNQLSYQKLAETLGTTMPSVRARCKKLRMKK